MKTLIKHNGVAFLFLTFFLQFSYNITNAQCWVQPVGYVSGDVKSISVNELKKKIVVGGSYNFFGINPNFNVFDGNQWLTPDSSFTSDVVSSSIFFNDTLYIVKNVSGGVFKQTPQGFQLFVAGLPTTTHSVFCFKIFNGELYCGTESGVYKLSLQQWDNIALATPLNGVTCMEEYNGVLYAGGYFNVNNGSWLNYIAQYNGSSWQAVGNGVIGSVDLLKTFNNRLYICGAIVPPAMVGTFGIATWDNMVLDTLPVQPQAQGVSISYAKSIEVFEGKLYVGGLVLANGIPYGIAVYNGVGWSMPSGGVGCCRVDAMAVYDSALYVGGYFSDTLQNLNSFRALTFKKPIAAIALTDSVVCQYEPLIVSSVTQYPTGDFQWYIQGANDSLPYPWPSVLTNYNTPGNYSVKLVVTNCNGSDSTTVPVQVRALPPIPTINVSNDTIYSSQAATYQWFVNGALSQGDTNQYFVYDTLLISTVWVEVTGSGGCINVSNSITVNLNETIRSRKLVCYPNPTRGIINFKWPYTGYATLALYNALGDLVFLEKNIDAHLYTTYQLSLESMPTGIYHLYIKNSSNQALYSGNLSLN